MSPSLQHNASGKGQRLGWDVLLFFALYIMAPSYLAVELHSRLPLITLSRGLLVLLALMLLIRRSKDLFRLQKPNLKALNLGLTECKLLRWGLLIYFGLLLLADVALFPADRGESLKALFVLLIEEYFMVWLLTLILDTRKKLLTALRTLTLASGCVSLIAIVGCIFNVNPFHWLNTVEREMLMTTYYRLGVLRAEAGFGHPVYFGAFCAVMVPLHMYFIEHSDARWQRLLFSGTMSLNLVSLLLSNSRGSLLAFGCLFVLIVLVRILKKEFKAFLRTYIPVFLMTLGLLTVVILCLPYGMYFLTETVRSLVSVFIPETSVGPDLPIPSTPAPTIPTEPMPEYGENAAGTRSRLVQLSGIYWTLSKKPLFGFGSNAHVRGLIAFQIVEGQWWTTKTFDMGLVAIVCQYGLAGLLGYGALYGSVFLTTAAKKFRKDPLMEQLGLAFIAYMLCLLTISSVAKLEWILFAAIICLANIILKERSAD